jgi:nucleotide-binding universal stress UspA family protein
MATPFARILLATEHSEFDTGAEALALALAHRCALPLVAVLPVVSNPEFESEAPGLAAKYDAQASARRESLEAMARAQDVPFDVTVRHGPEQYAEIVEEARERKADLIVIRRRGKRGLLANLLVGEMVSKVVAHAPCSVLIAPRNAQMWSKTVLVGIDPQAPNAATLGLAAGIAADCGQPLRVLCVATGDSAKVQAEAVLAAAVQKARAISTVVDGELRIGRPHQELIAAAKACAADLLVVARHRGDSLERVWVGGTTQKVIGLAECPVLVHVSTSTGASETI